MMRKPARGVSLVGSFRSVFRDFSSLGTPFLGLAYYIRLIYVFTAYVKHEFYNGDIRDI